MRKGVNNTVVATIILVAIFFLTGCNSNSETNKQVLHLSFSSDPPSFNPTRGGDLISSTVQFMLFEGLTKMSKESSCKPALAKSIVLSEDKKTYVFLLKSANWSDGHPVTAHDFVYAWKLMLSPDYPAPNAHLLYSILHAKEIKEGKLPLDALGVKAASDHMLVVTLSEPTPYFLELTSFCSFFPVPSHIAKNRPHWAESPDHTLVSNGPFKLEKYCLGKSLVLTKNEYYHDKQGVLLQNIDVQIIEDPMTALHLFQQGKLDFVGSPCSYIPSDSLPLLKKQQKLNTQPLGASSFFSFNLQRAPFNNANIRKALSYAIDRQSIVDFITQVGESPTIMAVPQVLKKDSPLNLQVAHFSNQQCQALFDEGLKQEGMRRQELPTFTVTVSERELPKRITQTVLANWKALFGLDIRMETVPAQGYLQKIYSKDFDIAYCELVAYYNDPMNVLERFKHKSNIKNYPGWENAEFIQILEDSSHIQNTLKRMKHLEKAEKLLLDEMPFSPIYHWNEMYLKNPEIKGLFISPIGSAHFEHCRRV